ncbi:MAG: hypothetical protein FJ096_20325 [Deltaproteobacteria bacterium]|nr:hypothetical protein [Deltaproteobacteria bacterium]
MTLDHVQVNGAVIQLGLPPQVGLLMTVVLRVHNPNAYDVAVRAVHGQVVFNERHVQPVEFRAPGEGVWLRADSVTQVAVPIQVSQQLALAMLADAPFAPTIAYHFTGRADVTATSTLRLERDDYAVDVAGSLTRLEIMAAMVPR